MGKSSTRDKDIALIIKALRNCSLKTSARKMALRRARRKVLVGKTKDGRDKWKYHWTCASCRKWSENEKEFQVDHIIEIGSFGGSWDDFILKLFFEPENQQVLCSPCHMKKTVAYNSAHVKFKRKKKY